MAGATAVILLSLVLVGLHAELRFHDAELMRSHHSHEPANNANLTIHLIPHSHDDVGWLKTVDDYYYGADQATQWAGVQYTLDTVVSDLVGNPDYKFSVVEIAFVYRWWNNANSTMRERFLALIQNKQIEIINAGWCMSDEAAPYYEDVIDQMTIGLRWTKEVLNTVPTIGWHIDPFGHQSTTAALFSQFGFNAWFFARIDMQDKDIRTEKRALEMMWHPFQHSAGENSIFTHVNYYMYGPPPGFCFDPTCKDPPIRSDPTLDGYDLPQRAESLVKYLRSMATHYRSGHLLHTLGSDFQFSNTRMWFMNMDRVIKYINDRPEFNITLKYSTPGIYLQAVNSESNVYPTKYDDFMPYSDREHGFWTGYFTSRVSLKGFVRDLGRYINTVRTHLGLLKLSNSSQVVNDNLDKLEYSIWQVEMAMGILQHHDAVSGTAKQKVTQNYFMTGATAKLKLDGFYSKVLKEQLANSLNETVQEFVFPHWNGTYEEWGISKVLATNKTVLLSIYNPGPKGIYTVRVRVTNQELALRTAANNSQLAGEILCVNKDAKDCELVFNLAFEETSYSYVKLTASKSGSAKVINTKTILATETTKSWNVSSTANLQFLHSKLSFVLSFSNGSVVYPFSVSYHYYESYQGTGQKSGAYIFRPSVLTIAGPRKYSTIKNVSYAEGSIYLVVVLEGDLTYTKLYFNKMPSYLETYGFETSTFVDSINIDDKQGKEIVMQVASDLTNNRTFFTDSNGLEEQKRIINFRPTWPFVTDEFASSNYYPVNSHVTIKDITSARRLTVMVDRSEGGTSLQEGCIELMVHRRTVYDDERGVFEPMNETDADGKGMRQYIRHFIVFGDQYRRTQKRNDQPLLVVWSNSSTASFGPGWQPSAAAIHVNEDVKLFLRPLKQENEYLLRLHNFNTQKPTQVVLPDGMEIFETTLGGNQLLEEWQANRMTWREEPYTMDTTAAEQEQRRLEQATEIGEMMRRPHLMRGSEVVQLKPFEIRTFLVRQSG